MNCLVVTDTNWDNIPIINKRLSYLSENTRVHVFYSKGIENLIKITSNLNLSVLRHSFKKGSEFNKILECLKVVDFCMVFTDLIEYNNIPNAVMTTCLTNEIPFFSFSNFNEGYFYKGELNNTKFKKVLREIKNTLKPRTIEKHIDVKIENIFIKDTDINKAVYKIKEKYSVLNSLRETKRIKLIDL